MYVEVQVYASVEVTWLVEDALDVVEVVVMLEIGVVVLDVAADVVARELVACDVVVDVVTVFEVVGDDGLLVSNTYAPTPATATITTIMTARKTGAIPRRETCK